MLIALSICVAQGQTFGGGCGTENDPYLITSQTDFEQIYPALSATNTFQGVHFKLTNDLTLVNFRPCYNFYATFRGHFDGNGHHIHLVSIDTLSTYNSLFYCIEGPGLVENIILSGDSIISSRSNDDAGIAHMLIGGGTIHNCENYRDIYGGSELGGIVRYSHSATITNCVNHGKIVVVGTTDPNNYHIGGITGVSAATVIEGCINYGDIFCTGGYVGGIAGTTSGSVANCRNYGNIYNPQNHPQSINDYDFFGGIVGKADAYDYPTLNTKFIRNCYNYANISNNTHNAYVGGIVGQVYTTTIEACANAGAIQVAFTDFAYVGGIAGALMLHTNISSAPRHTVSQCVNSGHIAAKLVAGAGPTIRSFSSVGGIGGNFGDSISHCMNAGTIEGGIAGGIIGSGVKLLSGTNFDSVSYPTHIDHCLNVGQVTSYLNDTNAFTLGQNIECYAACYYDKQMCTAPNDNQEGRNASRGLTTLQLVDGDTLTLETLWKAYAAMYPWPAALGDNSIAHAAATPVFLRQTPNPNFGSASSYPALFDTINSIDSCFSLGSGWRNTSLWTSQNHSVQIQGQNFPQITASGNDTLNLYIGDTLLKQVYPTIGTSDLNCRCLYNYVDDTIAPMGIDWVDGRTYTHNTHRPTHFQQQASETGCDTLRHLELIASQPDPPPLPDSVVTHLFDTICRGDTLIFNIYILTESGTYKEILVTPQGYDSIIYMHLTVVNGPEIELQYSVLDSITFRIDVDAPLGDVWWTATPADSTLTGQESSRSIVVMPQQTTQYTICIHYDDPELCPSKGSITIPVAHPIPPKPQPILFVPNCFTPLQTTNNLFIVKGINISSFEIYIYNRWGMLVWHSTDINESWNGRHKETLCPQGTYTYIINYTGSSDTGRQQQVGTVTIIR